ncbi:MAG: SoxR reducing system RseC family protein [Rikenellaceae bacterium]
MSPRTKGFKHNGQVVAIEEGGVVVISLRSATACEGCHAKSVCGSSGSGSDGQMREMRVVSERVAELSVGDSVEVGITYRIGAFAVVVAYLIPLILFIASLVISIECGVEQGVGALIAFLISALYYIGVYLTRDRFERVVAFEVTKR